MSNETEGSRRYLKSELAHYIARVTRLEQALRRIAKNKHDKSCLIQMLSLMDCDCAVVIARAALNDEEAGGLILPEGEA